MSRLSRLDIHSTEMETMLSPRPITTILATSTLIAALLVHPSTAGAAVAPLAVGGAEALVERLGPDATGGFYVDDATNGIVVNVTTEAAEQSVLDAGGVARRVTRSTAELKTIKEAFAETQTIRGTIRSLRNGTNQVNIAADSTVSEKDFAALKAKAEPYGDAVRVERINGVLAPRVSGGNYIVGIFDDFTGQAQCSLGFNVRSKSDADSLFFLTAGHCTGHPGHTYITGDWYSNNDYLGYRVGGAYNQPNGFDFGLVRHFNASVSKPGNVYLHATQTTVDITHSRDAGYNEYVCSSGFKSGYNCGHVTDTDADLTYIDGAVVKGMVVTDVCTLGGDSGGPLHHGDAALAILSASNSAYPCRSAHQPVNEALAWYDMEVY
jgi:streptogrisin D